jgi:antitoxin (DNA-binding transcriptional repressor) of toxin-antitoxin stability system
MSITVGVRDLKNSLSRWLRLVRKGESVIVLDRGTPVAILTAVPVEGAARTAADHLAGLAARGLLRLGSERRRRIPRRLPRVNLSDAVLEDRGEHA